MDILKRKREELAKNQADGLALIQSKSKEDWNSEDEVRLDGIVKREASLSEEVKRLELEERWTADNNEVIVEKAKKEGMTADELKIKSGDNFRNYLMGNWSGEDRAFYKEHIEKKTNAQSLTVTKGGYTVPEGFSNRLAVAELAYGNVKGISSIIKTAEGNDLPWPMTNDTGKVAYQINEATDFETSAEDIDFTENTLKAFKWTSGLVRVSYELLQDSYSNFEDLMIKLLGIRMGRGLNAGYTTGAGTTTIQGVVIGATDSAISSVGATAITTDNLIDLAYDVDPAYQINGQYMMNQQTLKAIMKLDVGTTDGNPVWQGSIQNGPAATIHGFPYTINQDMADIGASAKSVLFGDFKNYWIREVGGDRIKVLNELFAGTDQIGIVLIRRTDGQVIDAGTHPIKYMVHAAS